MHAYREKFAGGSISRKHQSIRDRSPDGSICVVVRTLLTARPARRRNRLASCGHAHATADVGRGRPRDRGPPASTFLFASHAAVQMWSSTADGDQVGPRSTHSQKIFITLGVPYLCSFFLRGNTISAVNFSVPGFDLSGNRDSGRTRTTKYEASPTGQ